MGERERGGGGITASTPSEVRADVAWFTPATCISCRCERKEGAAVEVLIMFECSREKEASNEPTLLSCTLTRINKRDAADALKYGHHPSSIVTLRFCLPLLFHVHFALHYLPLFPSPPILLSQAHTHTHTHFHIHTSASISSLCSERKRRKKEGLFLFLSLLSVCRWCA
jgi:hypothetical protein